MTEHDPQVPVAQIARRMTSWLRGRGLGTSTMVIVEDNQAWEWLGDPQTGLVDADSLVIAAGPRGALPALPAGPGVWSAAVGSVASAGADVGLGPDLYVETVGYGDVRDHGLLGPTAVRIFTPADARALADDARAAASRGVLPEALLHPAVELADQCALSGSPDRGAHGLERLHIDTSGAVRTSPAGRVLGMVGDSLEVLLRAAAGPDPCLRDEVRDVIEAAGPGIVSYFVAALRSIRTLSQREGRDWWIVDGRRSLLGDVRQTGHSRRALLISQGERFVVSDVSTGKSLEMHRSAATVVEAILRSDTIERAAELCRSHGTPSPSESEIRQLVDQCRERGVVLHHAVA